MGAPLGGTTGQYSVRREAGRGSLKSMRKIQREYREKGRDKKKDVDRGRSDSGGWGDRWAGGGWWTSSV